MFHIIHLVDNKKKEQEEKENNQLITQPNTCSMKDDYKEEENADGIELQKEKKSK